MPDAAKLAELLTERLGLALSGSTKRTKNGLVFVFRPADLDEHEGFAVNILIGWRSIEASFTPGKYSARLISSMQAHWPTHRSVFKAFISSALASDAKVSMRIGGAPVDPLNDASWPKNWNSLNLDLKSGPLEIKADDEKAVHKHVVIWGERLLGVIVSLLPLEEVVDGQMQEGETGLPEGAVMRVEVNRYERNPLNRAACIQVHGTSCKGCGFDFEKAYGDVGRGFIHVHHLIPVSKMGAGYIVDPVVDLIPICPNCHAMVHRREPPFSTDELRALLRNPQDMNARS